MRCAAIVWFTGCSFSATAVHSQSVNKIIALPTDLNGVWHLEYIRYKKVRVQYKIHCAHPDGMISEWEVIAAIPPDLPQQKIHSSHIFIYDRDVLDGVSHTVGDENQTIFDVVCPPRLVGQDDQLEATVQHEITYSMRKLVPGNAITHVKNLSASEQRFCLKETAEINFRAPEFQQFLTRNDLRRHLDESTLTFGRRVHHFVRAYMRYNREARFEDTSIVKDSKTRIGHCGNYSRMVVGIMRASDIPARLLFGHWLIVGKAQVGGQPHTEAEFFAPGIGWVLSDTSVSVPTGGWKPGWNIEEGFASEETGFIAFNLQGPLLLPTHDFGIQKQYHLQGIYTPAVGGDWQKMKIESTLQITELP